MGDPTRRTWVLTILAVAMGLMAISNFMKPVAQALDPETNAGFVLFGVRLEGVPNLIFATLFGALLAAYAWGVWTRRRWVVPLAIAYAAYVVVNLVLFVTLAPADRHPGILSMLAYALVAIGWSSGGAVYLWRRRELLE